jgi:hypothetical protein
MPLECLETPRHIIIAMHRTIGSSLTRESTTPYCSPQLRHGNWHQSRLATMLPCPPFPHTPSLLFLQISLLSGTTDELSALPFVPASSVPGFDGDHTWHMGFDTTSNGANSLEQHGVQLLGCKESICIMLETLLANTVCLYFVVFTDKNPDISTIVALLSLTSPCMPPTIMDTALQYIPTWDLVAYGLHSLWCALHTQVACCSLSYTPPMTDVWCLGS